MAHVNSVFCANTDVANFYPSIPYRRVYRLFCRELRCSPDVARILTKLCTYRYHLALGLITSPIIADMLMSNVDRRIGAMCERLGLSYTRFVDDITISSSFPVESGSVLRLVVEILRDNGYRVNQAKHASGQGRLSDGICITKLRIKRGRLDVRKEYYDRVLGQLEDAQRLAEGLELKGPFFSQQQIKGRINFIRSIKPGRSRILERRYRAMDWKRFAAEASAQGHVATQKSLQKANPD
jgi:retron-type reverse transcriptase